MIEKVLENSSVTVYKKKERALLKVNLEYSSANPCGSEGENDLISRQEAVSLVKHMNHKINGAILEFNKRLGEPIGSIPLELENIQSTLDYVIWALREIPSRAEKDLISTNVSLQKLNEYECIDAFALPVYDEYMNTTEEYGMVGVGSVWEVSDDISESDIRLNRISGNSDFPWIDITFEHLSECFKKTN